MLPLQFLLGRQLKGKPPKDRNTDTVDNRGIFEFFNYSNLRRFFLRRGYDGIILTDTVDSPVKTVKREHLQDGLRKHFHIETGGNNVDFKISSDTYYELYHDNDMLNHYYENEYAFPTIEKIQGRNYQMPIFPEFAFFSPVFAS